MRSIGLAEVRRNLEDLLAGLRDGGDPIAITDQDTTLAILMPPAEFGRPPNEETGAPGESVPTLRDTRRLFEETEQQARLGHWEWDEVADRCVYCSKELARLHGVTVDDYLATMTSTAAALEQVHPEDRARVEAGWRDVESPAKGRNQEFRLLRADGSVIEVREVAQRVFDESGSLRRSVGFLQDVTQRNRTQAALKDARASLDRTTQQRTLALVVAEAALRRSQTRLYDAIESSSEGFILFDAEERMVLCNGSFREQHADLAEFLVPRTLLKDLLRATAAKVVVPAAQAGKEDDIDERAESLLARYRNPGEPFEMQLRNDRWLLVSARRTREGGVVGISSDITLRRKIDETSRVRDAWLRAILDNTPILIALKDTDCRVMAVSANVTDYTGMTPEECIGLTAIDVLPPEVGAQYLAADREVLATGLPKQQEIAEDWEGTISYFLSSKFPLRDDAGQIIGICSLTSDITEAKRSELLLRHVQKMESIDQLTGGVAHDFNNLLGIIQGYAELLDERVQSGRELVAPILRAAERGAELTQSLLAFSRQQFLQPRSVDLAKRIEAVMKLLKRALGATIKVETRYAVDLWNAAADPEQVEDALLNLAINARDAMPEGGKLTIDCANIRLDEAAAAALPEMRAGDYVVLSVADTGVGMSGTARERAIEPFFTTKAFGRGSGLGLSMVYGFAKQSGGHIAFESEEGRGTIVRIYLPRHDEEENPHQSADPDELPRGRGQLVLVVEDNADMRRIAIRMLEELNYRVIEAPSALAARLVLAKNRDVDLLLTDIVLPGGLSGPAFAREAIAQAPRLAVVFMSGFSAENAGLVSHGVSGQDLLQKPFRKSVLARTLFEALQP